LANKNVQLLAINDVHILANKNVQPFFFSFSFLTDKCQFIKKLELFDELGGIIKFRLLVLQNQYMRLL